MCILHDEMDPGLWEPEVECGTLHWKCLNLEGSGSIQD